MNINRNTSVRFAGLLCAIVGSLALAACGGGGGSSSSSSSGSSSSGSSGTSTTTVTESCTGGNSNGATAIVPCATITGLSAGSSVTVTDSYTSNTGANETDSLTESANGTYSFASVPAETNAGGTAVGTFPSVTFTVSGNSQCINETSVGSYQATISCGTFPAVTPQVPTVQAMPGVSAPTVIGTPDIVPVVFNSSGASWSTGNQSNDVTFLQQFTASKVWGILSQYGIGAASVQSPVSVTNLTSSQTGSMLTQSGMESYIKANASTWDPGITNSTVFMVYLPPNQFYSPSFGSGYTGQVVVNSTTVTYAVVIDNNSSSTYLPQSSVYSDAEATLVQAVTNPTGSDGYAWLSSNTDVWLGASAVFGTGDEEYATAQAAITPSIGTLCSDVGPLQYSGVSIADVVPLWSNSDAAAGRNPCQPELSLTNSTYGSVLLSASTENYVGAAEQSPAATTATATIGGVTHTDQVVQVSPGQSVNLTFTFFTTQPISGSLGTSGIPVQAAVLGYVNSTDGVQPIENGDIGGNSSTPALLTVSAVKNLSRTGDDGYALNGDELQVTVTASTTTFSGMYVLALSIPCGEMSSSGAVSSCADYNSYTSIPVGITESSTWK